MGVDASQAPEAAAQAAVGAGRPREAEGPAPGAAEQMKIGELADHSSTPCFALIGISISDPPGASMPHTIQPGRRWRANISSFGTSG